MSAKRSAFRAFLLLSILVVMQVVEASLAEAGCPKDISCKEKKDDK